MCRSESSRRQIPCYQHLIIPNHGITLSSPFIKALTYIRRIEFASTIIPISGTICFLNSRFYYFLGLVQIKNRSITYQINSSAHKPRGNVFSPTIFWWLNYCWHSIQRHSLTGRRCLVWFKSSTVRFPIIMWQEPSIWLSSYSVNRKRDSIGKFRTK